MDEKTIAFVKDMINSLYGFVAVDEEGKIMLLGEQYAKDLGISVEDAIGKRIEDVISNTELLDVLETKKSTWNKFYWAKSGITGERTPAPSLCTRLLIRHKEEDGTVKIAGVVGFGTITRSVEEGRLLAELETLREQNELYQEHLAHIYRAPSVVEDILGMAPVVRNMKELIQRVAGTAVSVCIFGETGTGKELVANAIHKLSKRADKPFVKINCAAIPKDLMESELFGYEPGSFTGASRQGKIGKFELANGGTLLLDEIGELPLNLQAKLLRVLQSKEVERVGGAKPIPIDVRILCSTNRDLQQMISEGTFRTDLYYRINTMEIAVPALRDRTEDIPNLAEHFISKANERNDLSVLGLSVKAKHLLLSHNWPGNIRELEHSVERACVLRRTGYLQVEDFSTIAQQLRQEEIAVQQEERGLMENTSYLKSRTGVIEQQTVLDALTVCKGNKRAAADMLGITRATLYSKMKKYGIPL